MKFHVGQRVRNLIDIAVPIGDLGTVVGFGPGYGCNEELIWNTVYVVFDSKKSQFTGFGADGCYCRENHEIEPLRDDDTREIEAWAQRRTRDLVSKLTGYVPGEAVRS